MATTVARTSTAKPHGKKIWQGLIRPVIVQAILVIAGLSFLFPFLWMLTTSLKVDTQIFADPPVWIPNPFAWENFPKAVTYIPFVRYFGNTMQIAILSAIGVVISCSLVAYSLARLQWPGRDFLFILTLSTMMLPFAVTMIPLFIVFKNLGWINTFNPLIVPHFFGGAFFIFLLRQFFMTIPLDLSDAARIDGASELGIFTRIILPLTRPAIATIALLQFLGSYRDFMGPLIYLTDETKYTLSIGLTMFSGQHTTEWSLLMAASVLMSLPIIVLFFFTQRTFVQGITLTGIKG